MIKTQNRTENKKSVLSLIVLSLIFILSLSLVNAQPTGVTISDNITETAGITAPSNRTDDGGTITTLVLDVLQQNIRWKAYTGNMSGVLTLDDASGQSIFQWQMGAQDVTGDLFVSRSDSVDWDAIQCSNESLLVDEQTFLGMGALSVDNLNRTFNETTHPQINIGLITIAQNTCRSAATYVNNTAQDISSADFPILALSSSTDIVYATPINKGASSYSTGDQTDFQIIVPNNPADTTTYFFYAQLG
jgi:hypothetical protein